MQRRRPAEGEPNDYAAVSFLDGSPVPRSCSSFPLPSPASRLLSPASHYPTVHARQQPSYATWRIPVPTISAMMSSTSSSGIADDRTLRRQRLADIGHGENTAELAEVAGLESDVMSSAIQPLMVRRGDPGEGTKARHPLQDFRGVAGMFPHLIHLHRAQLAGLSRIRFETPSLPMSCSKPARCSVV